MEQQIQEYFAPEGQVYYNQELESYFTRIAFLSGHSFPAGYVLTSIEDLPIEIQERINPPAPLAGGIAPFSLEEPDPEPMALDLEEEEEEEVDPIEELESLIEPELDDPAPDEDLQKLIYQDYITVLGRVMKKRRERLEGNSDEATLNS